MPLYSRITDQHYQLDTRVDPPVQLPIENSNFKNFVYTNDMMFYTPNHLDFEHIILFGNVVASLNPTIASAIYATVLIQKREIITAAYGHSFIEQYKLPSHINKERLDEIGMIHPPFPDANYFATNFLTMHAPQAVLESFVIQWQQVARKLAAWIAQAKENARVKGISTWEWSTIPGEPSMPISPEESVPAFCAHINLHFTHLHI